MPWNAAAFTAGASLVLTPATMSRRLGRNEVWLKKVFAMYLAKEGNPNSDAYAKLDLPASPWELWDALDKVRLQKEDILYMEIEDYYAFAYLAPHLDGLEISLNELNDLAAQLAAFGRSTRDRPFEGLFSIAVQRKVNANGGVITLQDLRDLAVSAKKLTVTM